MAFQNRLSRGIKASLFKKNDVVAIVATAKKFQPSDLDKALEIIESWGLKIKLGKNLFKEYHQFAGTDEERLQDLQEMIDDPFVKAILCVRGGYGSTRIIDRVTFGKLLDQPKWIAGFSDITAILFQLFNVGLESVHSTMPLLFQEEGAERAVESLRKVLFGEPIEIDATYHPLNKEGMSRGRVIGGNLSIINHLIGTPSDINMKDKILFIEDLDEYLYHIDRMMIQLKRAGKLNGLAGLVVGQMTGMKDNQIPFGASAYDIIHEHTQEYGYPVCFGFPVGHVPENIAMPFGREAILEVKNDIVCLKYF